MQLAELAAAVLASEATLGQQHQEDCLLLMTRLLDDPSYPARRAAAYLLPAASQLCVDQVTQFGPKCKLTEPIDCMGRQTYNPSRAHWRPLRHLLSTLCTEPAAVCQYTACAECAGPQLSLMLAMPVGSLVGDTGRGSVHHRCG